MLKRGGNHKFLIFMNKFGHDASNFDNEAEDKIEHRYNSQECKHFRETEITLKHENHGVLQKQEQIIQGKTPDAEEWQMIENIEDLEDVVRPPSFDSKLGVIGKLQEVRMSVKELNLPDQKKTKTSIKDKFSGLKSKVGKTYHKINDKIDGAIIKNCGPDVIKALVPEAQVEKLKIEEAVGVNLDEK